MSSKWQGQNDRPPLRICWECKGAGRVIVPGFLNKVETCPTCKGERVARY